MDHTKPENIERIERSSKAEIEKAEVNLRSLERKSAEQAGNVPDTEFIDKSGRSLTIRTWESGDRAYIRAYDTDKAPVPEHVNPGQAGYANASLERSGDGQSTRVRLNDIVTTPEYRTSGTGGQMLDQVEGYAKRYDAKEIYGSIDSQDAQNYWQRQSDNGWTIDHGKGTYGEVRKKLV